MAIDYGPFDSGIGANRTEDWWRAYFRHLTGAAVIEGERSEFAVAERGAGANLSVDVAAGTAFIRGHWVDSDATENKAIAAADPTNPRKDRVVLRADFTANTISIEVLTGTPAGSPTVPSLTQSTSRWEIALATVDVAANEDAIEDGHITDERTLHAYGIGSSVEDLPTAETDTALVLKPDGAGGVEWGAGAGGATVLVKPSDESVTSSNTLQDDDDLTFAVAANEEWLFEFVVFMPGGDTAADIKVSLGVPSGADYRWGVQGYDLDAESDLHMSAARINSVSFLQLGIPGASSLSIFVLRGHIVVDSTPGSVVFRWAQNASSATATTVAKGSYLVARKVA